MADTSGKAIMHECEGGVAAITREREGDVAIITLNRPEAKNSLSAQALQELRRAIVEIDHDDGIRGVVVTGAPSCFSAGADIVELAEKLDRAGEASRQAHEVFGALEGLRKPVVAAVEGLALGGGFELSLACDLCVAGETAVFGFPEVKLGAIPCWGGTFRLTRLAGPRRAKQLMLTGRQLSASEASEWGIVNRVVEAGSARAEAVRMLGELLGNPSSAIGCVIECINAAADEGATALELEASLIQGLAEGEELKTRLSAFSRKRG